VSFYTRNGKPEELLTESLAHDFIKLADILGKDKVVFDGELVVYENGTIANRQTGNGILNKAVRGTISEAESNMIQATIWDVINYDAFSSASADKTTYEERFGKLQKISFQGISKIGLVESFEANSAEEIHAIYTKYLEAGQEGIILKDKRGIWENKRTKSQIKFKNESTCELLVTDWIEGTGKYEGVLGALSCQSSDGNLSVNVGSGFNEAQRSEMTRENIVGKIVEVKYNGKIVNKNGGSSLFLPIFIRIREDKDVANNIDEISNARCL
jgi:ATP-dependent DNA ligase